MDDFAEAVIAARRLAAEARGPFFVAGKPVEGLAAGKQLGLRMSGCAGGAARLILVTHPKFADHPLLEEGIRLREELQARFEELLVEYRALRRQAVRINWR
ncbi:MULTISPECIES: hypothetical protein [Methylobacterium]|uniref:Uncharacterized protein n=1 Tax=Methylobacterium ajmalii TaxID=2738439 RepID=A0ABV0A1V7_9HYPH|nr:MULTISPECIES: hypothetical protein [Methylobacterium]MBK3397095.1 hypothetical protein [Methylobacterium ajmalii]MBK3408310.1 hypothetical protein [Methylobacterium ajmalii]MBK3421125.1 hypothetical protein [Methylobacterium ajmalii]MBZ6411114.1 hypothetical protein [Methylobacterium sp.]